MQIFSFVNYEYVIICDVAYYLDIDSFEKLFRLAKDLRTMGEHDLTISIATLALKLPCEDQHGSRLPLVFILAESLETTKQLDAASASYKVLELDKSSIY